MSDNLHNYRSSLDIEIQKDADNDKYNVNVKKYNLDIKVSEDYFKFDINVQDTDPFPEITGTYQLFYSTYRTDTSVKNPPMEMHLTSGMYARNLFTNCISFKSVNLTTDITIVEDVVEDEFISMSDYMFAGCESLISVNLGAYFENTSREYVVTLTNMFNGCTALETITGTIDLSSVPYTSMKDMFKNCTNLQSVTIKNGNDDNSILAQNVTIDGNTYDYAYMYLGLNAEQIENVVTII